MRSRRRVSLLGETTSKTPNRTPRDDREVRSTSETRRILPADRVPGPSIDCSCAVAAFGTPAFVKVYGGQLENRQKIPFKAGSLTRTRKKQPFKRAGALSRGAGAGVRKGFGRHGAAGHVRADGVPHPVHVGLRRQAGACATANLVGIPRVHGVSPVLLVLHAPRVSRQSRRRPTRSTISNPRGNPQILSTTDPSDRQRAQVHLCGSFTNWLETVPMAPEPAPNGGSVFAVVCNLPPGYHQYKFIVDGEWRHDENQAFIQDPLGNVNNWCEHRPARASIPRARPTPRGDKTHPAKPPAPRKQQPSLFSRWHAVSSPPGY